MKKALVLSLGLIFVLFVCATTDYAKGPSKTIWRVPGHFPTIQDAIDSPSVKDGHSIYVGSGYHALSLIHI